MLEMLEIKLTLNRMSQSDQSMFSVSSGDLPDLVEMEEGDDTGDSTHVVAGTPRHGSNSSVLETSKEEFYTDRDELYLAGDMANQQEGLKEDFPTPVTMREKPVTKKVKKPAKKPRNGKKTKADEKSKGWWTFFMVNV